MARLSLGLCPSMPTVGALRLSPVFRATSQFPSSASSSRSPPSSLVAAEAWRSPSMTVYSGGGGSTESFCQMAYRWLDITGFLTRWNNRKAWVMDLDPYSRMGTIMITEFERKLLMFMGFHAYLFYIISMLAWWRAQTHFSCKPPCPKHPNFGHMDGRKKDFEWHGKFFFMYPKSRCKECRWLEPECKRRCFDRLKAEGHKLIINNGNPLSSPRHHLEPTHFNH